MPKIDGSNHQQHVGEYIKSEVEVCAQELLWNVRNARTVTTT